MPSELRKLPYVGGYYRNLSNDQIRRFMTSYDYVIIVKDNNNKHDSNAFRVYAIDDAYNFKWCHMGYIQRHAALSLMNYLIDYFDNEQPLIHGQYLVAKPIAVRGEWFVEICGLSDQQFNSQHMNKLYTIIKNIKDGV